MNPVDWYTEELRRTSEQLREARAINARLQRYRLDLYQRLPGRGVPIGRIGEIAGVKGEAVNIALKRAGKR